MTKTYTPTDVIRYIYGERMSSVEKNQIECAIINNNELADIYAETVSLKAALSKIKREPSQRTIDTILNFSRAYNLPIVAD